MQIIGHNLIKFEPFNEVGEKEIANFDNLLFSYDEKMVQLSKQSGKRFSIKASNLSQIILSNAFGATYIVLPFEKEILKCGVLLAQEYLFDSKIATIIKNIEELEICSKMAFVDAVILPNAIIKR